MSVVRFLNEYDKESRLEDMAKLALEISNDDYYNEQYTPSTRFLHLADFQVPEVREYIKKRFAEFSEDEQLKIEHQIQNVARFGVTEEVCERALWVYDLIEPHV